MLGFLAVPMFMISIGRPMRANDWIVVFIMISPVFIHGLLGARRGPTFLSVAGVIASYVMVYRPSISITRMVLFTAGLGLLLLFLVANRHLIYLGGDLSDPLSVTEYMKNWEGNEYLFGSAIFRYGNNQSEPFYGLRVLFHMVGRLTPKSIWPTVYDDLAAVLGPDVDYKRWSGIPALSISYAVGWQIAEGAAPGLAGDMFLEFGYLSILVAGLIGWLYGRIWKLSQADNIYVVFYIVLVGLSIFLISQTIEAWLFRLLWFVAPAAIISQWRKIK